MRMSNRSTPSDEKPSDLSENVDARENGHAVAEDEEQPKKELQAHASATASATVFKMLEASRPLKVKVLAYEDQKKPVAAVDLVRSVV
jgi:hypothetical protein